jgi:integrase/recombinase XerD
MEKSSKPIIEHIPLFLNYCKEIGLSERTFKNYKNYLKRFILWLKRENKNTLLPHELTANDINAYKFYLSNYKDEKGRPLKKLTQNYYLIALRALLGYFIAKDIVSLLPAKITLPKDAGREKTVKFLNLEQIERLLLAPDIKTATGLRDRAILKTIVSTGLKVNQLIKLNRNQLKDMPGEVLPLLEEYLKTRRDRNTASFINYRAKRKSIGERLTARSIERIVNYYGRKINLPFFITPEILRWTRARMLSNEEIKIQRARIHQTLITENYKDKESPLFDHKKPRNLSSSWYNIENLINREINWMKSNIAVFPSGYKENPPFLRCDDCILRKIAILIVSGKVKAAEIRAKENKDLWDGLTENMNFKKINRHGREWHRKMMDVVSNYFITRDYKVNFEPILHYGRADLGVFMEKEKPLYIEIGTVSLFKLWYNLSVMKNVTFLIIPSENNGIEFNT